VISTNRQTGTVVLECDDASQWVMLPVQFMQQIAAPVSREQLHWQ
jgi:hypothetical protein